MAFERKAGGHPFPFGHDIHARGRAPYVKVAIVAIASVILFSIGSAPIGGAATIEEVAHCRAIQINKERVACFDALKAQRGATPPQAQRGRLLRRRKGGRLLRRRKGGRLPHPSHRLCGNPRGMTRIPHRPSIILAPCLVSPFASIVRPSPRCSWPRCSLLVRRKRLRTVARLFQTMPS